MSLVTDVSMFRRPTDDFIVVINFIIIVGLERRVGTGTNG